MQNNLREVRTQKGMTQVAVANAAGTSERCYQAYEKRKIYSADYKSKVILSLIHAAINV